MKEISTLNGDESIGELRQMQDRDEVTGGHQRNPTALRHILAPTDLTLDAQKAVDYAVNLARGFGARLTLLHVYNSDFNCDYVLARSRGFEGYVNRKSFKINPSA